MHIVVTLQDIGFFICVGIFIIARIIIFLIEEWKKRK